MDEALKRYHELLGKVDRFSAAATAEYGSGLVCRAGCDECCGRSFSVFRVEAHNLLAGFALLGHSEKRIILAKCAAYSPLRPECVLLEGGRCMLYKYRPVICRTHGLPITSGHLEINGASTVSSCPRNFTEPGALEKLPREFILDVDTLNKILAAINMLYIKELCEAGSADPAERIPLHEIFTAG